MADDASSNSRDGRTVSLPVLGSASRTATRIRPSRSARWRALALATVQVLMIVHFVHWIVAGRTVSPLEPSEAMATVKDGVINAGTVLLVVALLATLLLGRWFCGWGCHIVMLQDLCAWLLKRVGLRPRPFRSRLLVYAPFILGLYMFVWPAVYRWGVAPLHASLHTRWPSLVPDPTPVPAWRGFTLEMTTDDFWQSMPGVLVAIPFLLVCGFAIVWFLGAKGYCTYACPYGGLFAPVEQYSPFRIRVTDACHQCGHCTAVCTSNVRVHEEVRTWGMVVDPGCMKCLDCVSVCPNDALYYGFGRPAAFKGAPRTPPRERTHDLSRREELAIAAVWTASFLAVWSVYALVPMLFAAGIAGCVTYVLWKAWRVLRDRNASFHRHRLRVGGRLTGAGRAWIAVAGLVALLVAHTGLVRWIERVADRAERVASVPRSVVLTTAPMILPEHVQAAAAEGLRAYDLLRPVGKGGIALVQRADLDLRRSWLLACLHRYDEAEAALRADLERHGPRDQLVADIALLMLVRALPDDAVAWMREWVEREPLFVITGDQLATWIEREIDAFAAIDLARTMLARIEALPSGRERDAARLHVMRRLSLLEVDHGDLDRGIELFEETIRIDDVNAPSRLLLARAYLRRGDELKAVEQVEAALRIAGDRPQVREEAAEFYRAIGRTERAAELVERGGA